MRHGKETKDLDSICVISTVIYLFWALLSWPKLTIIIFVVLYYKAAMSSMDGIIDTVSAKHPLLPLIGLLKSHGKLVMVGAPDKPLELPILPLIFGKFYRLSSHGLG